MTQMIGPLLCGFTDIVRLLISAGANVNLSRREFCRRARALCP
jgi:hypothetical protein